VHACPNHLHVLGISYTTHATSPSYNNNISLKLHQGTIRLNMWPLALETLEPAWMSFKNEGAHVRVY
jgi:hypothetical protein